MFGEATLGESRVLGQHMPNPFDVGEVDSETHDAHLQLPAARCPLPARRFPAPAASLLLEAGSRKRVAASAASLIRRCPLPAARKPTA
jgi:hypothetical protein